MALSRVINTCRGGHLALTHYAPFEVCPAHRHENVQVSLVLSGAYREDGPAGPIEADDGLLTAKPAGHEHATVFGAAGALILTFNLSEAPFLHRYFAARDRGNWTTMVAASAADDPAAFAAMCAGEPRDVTPVDAHHWLARARDRLAEEGQLRSGAVAREVGLHPVRFAKLFQAAFGRAPGALRQSRRTARAIDRIIRSSCCLADIACETGFADQAHMTRTVTTAVGVPPARLRRVFAAG